MARWFAAEVVQTSGMDCGPASLRGLLLCHGLDIHYQGAELLLLDAGFAALDPHTLTQAMDTVRRRAPTLRVVAHPEGRSTTGVKRWVEDRNRPGVTATVSVGQGGRWIGRTDVSQGTVVGRHAWGGGHVEQRVLDWAHASNAIMTHIEPP